MAAQVPYRRLGTSGLRVSVPILGAMSFGTDKWQPWVLNEDKALPILKAAWERGVTTWDTANMYSNGESERIIAKAIKEFDIPRHRLVLLTKCNGLVEDAPPAAEGTPAPADKRATRDYVNQSGLSRAAIFNAVEASLARLETPYIDLLQIHRADFAGSTPEETMKALHDLVQSGKVRYIGASSMWTWQFATYNAVAEKNGWTRFISMQNSYSLLYREEEREMHAYCAYAGIGLIPWGPLAMGRLARPRGAASTARAKGYEATGWFSEFSAWEAELVDRVQKIASDRGWTMGQVALAWVGAKVTSPIVGFSSVERMEEAIIPGKTLTDEEMKLLEGPYQVQSVKGHS